MVLGAFLLLAVSFQSPLPDFLPVLPAHDESTQPIRALFFASKLLIVVSLLGCFCF